MVFIVALNCIFLMLNDVECLYICLVVIPLSFFMKCSLKYFTHFNYVVGSFITESCGLKIYFIIFMTKLIYIICKYICTIFSCL